MAGEGVAAPGVSEEAVTARGDVFRLTLLDGFRLASSSAEVISLPHSAERLLAFMALRRRSSPRGYVAGTLWLDSSEERALGSLRSALWRLRRQAVEIVEDRSGCLELGGAVCVDVTEAEARARRLLDPAATCHNGDVDGGHARGDFACDLLPGWYDEWVVLERERFRQIRLHALEALAGRLSALGRHGEAVEAAMAAVHEEPLRESAQRTLIEVHLAEGNAAEALSQYESYRLLVAKELGLRPSPALLDVMGPLTQR